MTGSITANKQRLSKITTLSKTFVLLISLASPGFAHAAGNACSALFEPVNSEARYDWLRLPSRERDQWINDSVDDINAVIAKSKSFPGIARYFRSLYDHSVVTSIAKFDSMTVTLVDTGLGTGKSTDVMVAEGTNPPTRMLSSYDLRGNNTFMPTSVAISPDGKFISVAAAERGSIDVYTHIIFDAKTKKEVGRVSGTNSEEIVWLAPGQFSFGPYSGEKLMRAQVMNDGIQVSESPYQYSFSAALDGKLLYLPLKDRTFIMPFGTPLNQAKAIDVGNVRNIFSPDNKRIYFQTAGENGFGEIRKLEVVTDASGTRTAVTKTIVGETNFVVKAARFVDEALVVSLFRGQDRRIDFYTQTGELAGRLAMPLSSAGDLRSVNLSTGEVLMTLSSPVAEGHSWKHDLKTGKWFTLKNDAWIEANPAEVMLRDGADEYVVEYQSFKSADGTDIPVRITRKKNLAANGSNPTYMQGYGGFGLNSYFHPFFEPMTREFLRRGGIHVAPALRGSTFFGKPWHDAGRAMNKQNVINDFIGAAELMIRTGWTSPHQLAISGASHGGLLVGASITQRPELFGLALPQFGPHDFARKPTLDPVTTPYQVSEYGDLIHDPAAQALARKISPFDNAKPANYPLTVVITGRNDSRVNPTHSYLFAAKLKENQTGPMPVYLFALKNAGHWASSEPLEDLIAWRENAVYWSLLFDYFNMAL
jgi:acetyl esterase/lipase